MPWVRAVRGTCEACDRRFCIGYEKPPRVAWLDKVLDTVGAKKLQATPVSVSVEWGSVDDCLTCSARAQKVGVLDNEVPWQEDSNA